MNTFEEKERRRLEGKKRTREDFNRAESVFKRMSEMMTAKKEAQRNNLQEVEKC